MTATAFGYLSEGIVSTRPQNGDTAVAAGPRCAVRRDGDVLCSFIVQTAPGSNDFRLMLVR